MVYVVVIIITSNSDADTINTTNGKTVDGGRRREVKCDQATKGGDETVKKDVETFKSLFST